MICHENCSYGDDDKDKQHCCAMKQSYCTVCPKKCKYDVHNNYRAIKTSTRYWDEIITSDELVQNLKGMKDGLT